MSSSGPTGAAGAFAGRTFIILNPKAGHEETSRMRRLIGGAFAARSASFDLATTERPGHATELARDAARLGYRAVCIVGGDGTLAEVATGLAGTDVPLALIPRGTANQVALNLRIPADLETAVDVALEGEPTPVDLGLIGDRAFALVAGAGYDAAVMSTATRELKERWGFGAYLYAAAKEALVASPARFRIRADGREFEIDAAAVMLANMGELFAAFLPFGFSLSPQPTSSWQDGLLEVVALAPRGLTGFASMLWKSATRQFGGDDHLLHFRAQEVFIEAEPPTAVQIDGDPAGQTPIHASVMRGGIRMLTPA